MDRKKTILIAVAMNAGLLAVLFAVAAKGGEDPSAKAMTGQTVNHQTEFVQPLFHEKSDFILEQAAAEPVKPVEIPLAIASPPVDESPMHKLPPMTPEFAAPTRVPVAPTESAVQNPSATFEVTVQKGDSLDRIARKHHTTTDVLIQLNHLPSNFLKVGQRLKVLADQSSSAPAKKATLSSSEKAEYYTMKVGDNPWTIAMKHHMKVDELLKLNGLNEKTARKLKPGDRLRIR